MIFKNKLSYYDPDWFDRIMEIKSIENFPIDLRGLKNGIDVSQTMQNLRHIYCGHDGLITSCAFEVTLSFTVARQDDKLAKNLPKWHWR